MIDYPPMKLIPGFSLDGFSRITHHSSEAQEYWGPVIQKARRASDETELVSVAEGLRDCGTVHIPNVNGDRVYATLAKYGLKWKRLVQVGPSEGFSHRSHPPVEPGNPNFTWFSVVAKTEEKLEEFSEAHGTNQSNHEWIGQLLGFPICCRKFFTDQWPKYCDPIWQSALRTPGAEIVEWPATEMPVHVLKVTGHPGCNVMLRYIGARTWFHLPCSLRCEKTIELSEQWLQLVREYDEAGYTAMKYLLSLPLAWDVCHGYARVLTPAFTVHAGSVESAERYIVECEHDPYLLPAGEPIPGAVNGMRWPLRPGEGISNAPLYAAGGLSSERTTEDSVSVGRDLPGILGEAQPAGARPGAGSGKVSRIEGGSSIEPSSSSDE